MRKCFTLLAILLFPAICVLTTGCGEKTEDRIVDVIILSRDVVPFATEGGTGIVAVASPSKWTPKCEETWVDLTPGDGLLTISVGKNTSSNVRKATITIESAADEKTITIEQAFLQQVVSLTVVAPEELVLDSEEDSSIISVVTNGEWEVASNATWLKPTPDFERNRITLVAEPNGGEAERPATITVTSSLGGSTKHQDVAIRQISRSENPYYKLLGNYGLRAENWYYDSESIGASGIATYCTIEENEYRKSVYIKDLFTSGTVIEAEYDRENNTLAIPLGKICKQITYSQSSQLITRYYYPIKVNMEAHGFQASIINGIPGRAEDDEGRMQDAIILSGFNNEYPGFGLIAVEGVNYLYFSDMYYAMSDNKGEMYFVKAESPVAAAAKANPEHPVRMKSFNQ